MARIFRFFTLLLALGAAVLLPLAATVVKGAYQRYAVAEEDLLTAQREADDKERYQQRLKDYDDYTSQAGEFLATATQTGLTPESWVRYDVDVKNRVIDVTTLYTILQNGKNGTGYYFRPELLELTSLADESVLPKEVLDVVKREKVKIEPGTNILVSVKGTYLVSKQ